MSTSPAIKYDTFNPFVLARIPKDASVLDIGCATGLLGSALRARGNAKAIVGVDANPAATAKAAPHYDNVFVCDLENTDFATLGNNTFDVIVCADVLEHLRDPLSILRRLTPFLTPQGRFLISIPNVAFLQVRLALLFGRFTYQKCGGIMDHEHMRFFTRAALRQLLMEANLHVRYIHGYNLVRPRYAFLKALGMISPTLFCIQFLAEAEHQR